MSQPSDPTPRPAASPSSISRIGLTGAVLGIVLIGLFIGLWIVLGSAGVEVFPRLVIAVCAPPSILAALIGIYLLLTRPRA
jgi:predicted lipid-binding transport protein (Tim44 family)